MKFANYFQDLQDRFQGLQDHFKDLRSFLSVVGSSYGVFAKCFSDLAHPVSPFAGIVCFFKKSQGNAPNPITDRAGPGPVLAEFSYPFKNPTWYSPKPKRPRAAAW